MRIWSDGACSNNPGNGGYAAYIENGLEEIAICGSENYTTNNRMELMGFISGLRFASDNHVKDTVTIYTDSKYIENAINCKWINKWQTKAYKDIKNDDLWRLVWELINKLSVRVIWVKGHANDKGNIVADMLATESRDGIRGKYSIIYF